MHTCSLEPNQRDDTMVEQLLHACMPIILPGNAHGAEQVFAAAAATLLAEGDSAEHTEVVKAHRCPFT